MATIFAQICSDGIVFGTHGKVKLMIDSLTIAQIGHGDTHLSLMGDAGVIRIMSNAIEIECGGGHPKIINIAPELQLTTGEMYKNIFNNIVKYFNEHYPSMVRDVHHLVGILIHHGEIALCAGGSIYNHGQLKLNYMAVGDDPELITPHLYYADLTHPNSTMSEYMEFLKLSVANYAQYHGPDIDKINLTEVPRPSN